MRTGLNARSFPCTPPMASAKSCGGCNESVTTRRLGLVACIACIEIKHADDSTPCDYFNPKATNASRNR